MGISLSGVTQSSTGNLTISAGSGNDILIGNGTTVLYVDGGTDTLGIGAAAQSGRALSFHGALSGINPMFISIYPGVVTASSGTTIRYAQIAPTDTQISAGVDIGTASTLALWEGVYTKNGDATLANTATLYIGNAATEGATGNYALWVDDGAVKFDDRTFSVGGVNYEWPNSLNAGTYLKTDSSGNLEWAAATASATGSGTTGKLTKWTNGSGGAIGDSVMIEAGASIGIGVTPEDWNPSSGSYPVDALQLGPRGSVAYIDGHELMMLTNNVWWDGSNMKAIETGFGPWIQLWSSNGKIDMGYSDTVSADANFARTTTMTLLQGGKVGIGTAAPDRLLHIYAGDSAATPRAEAQLVVEENDDVEIQLLTPNNKSGGISFGDPQNNIAGMIQYQHATANQRFSLHVNSAERLRITDASLDFLQATAITTAAGNLTLSAATGSDVIIGDNDNILYVDGGTGSVFIGTALAAVAAKLLIESAGTGYQAQLYFTNPQSHAAGVGHQIGFYGGSGDQNMAAIQVAWVGSSAGDGTYMAFATRNVGDGSMGERVRIDTSGNVGIGATTVDTLLHLEATRPVIKLQDSSANGEDAMAFISFRSADNTEIGWVGDGSPGNDDIYLQANTGSLLLLANGTIEMNARLRVTGSESGTNILAGSGDAGIQLRNSNATDNTHAAIDFHNNSDYMTAKIGALFKDTSDRDTDLYFATRADGGNLTERMRIASGGEIGIGVVSEDWQSGFTVLRLGGLGSLNVDSAGAGAGYYMGNNVYRDEGNDRWEYIVADEATQYVQYNGVHQWRTAVAGSNANDPITWINPMIILANGKVGIGTATPHDELQIHDEGGANVRLLMTNNTTTSAADGGLRIQQDGINTIINNQEAGAMTLQTGGAMTLSPVGILTLDISANNAAFKIVNSAGHKMFEIDSRTTNDNILVMMTPPSITDAAAAGTNNAALELGPSTITLTGTTTVNSFDGGLVVRRRTITDSSALTVTQAHTVYIEGPPIAAGSVTITNPYALYVAAGVTAISTGSSSAPGLAFNNDPDTGIYRSGGGQVGITGDGAVLAQFTPAYFDLRTALHSSGNYFGAINTGMVLGHTTHVTAAAQTPEFQILGGAAANDDFAAASMMIGRWTNDTTGPFIMLAKSRHTTIDGDTIVVDGDGLGTIIWTANDGIDMNGNSAQISAEADGTIAGNRVPGRIVFKTTADAVGATNAIEKMRIDSGGAVNIQDNGTNSTNKFARITGSHFLNAEEDILIFELRSDTNDNILSIGGSSTSYNTAEYIDFWTASTYNTTQGVNRMRINSSGYVGINTVSMNEYLKVVGESGNQMTLDNGGQDWTQLNYANNGTDRTFISLDYGNHYFIIGSQSSYSSFDSFRFRYGNTDLVTIDANGNVGIGDTNPSEARLVVEGDNNSTIPLFRLVNADSTYSQSMLFSLDTNKDMLIAGGSGSGGIKLAIGTRGLDLGNVPLYNVGNAASEWTTGALLLHSPAANNHAKLELNQIGGGSGDAIIRFQESGTSKFTVGLDDTDTKFKISDGGDLGTNDRLTIDSVGHIGYNKANTAPNVLNLFTNNTETIAASAEIAILYISTGSVITIGTGTSAQVASMIMWPPNLALADGSTVITNAATLFLGGGVTEATNNHVLQIPNYTAAYGTADSTNHHTVSIGRATLTGSNANTITNSASLYIANAPYDHTNITVTNGPYALWVDAGDSRFDGNLLLQGTHASENYITTNANTSFGRSASNTTEIIGRYVLLNASDDVILRAGSTDAIRMYAGDDSNPRITIDRYGSVGIGETSPFSLLHVRGAETGEGTALGQLTLESTVAYGSSPDAGIVFRNIYTGSSPAIMGGIKVTKTDGNAGNYSGDMTFQVREHGAVAYDAMTILYNGNVGIGISPTYTPASSRRGLQITNGSNGALISLGDDATESANPRIFSTSTGLGFATASGGDTWFYDGTTLNMTIAGNGNVSLASSITIAGGSPADGKVWTATDSSGNGQWETPLTVGTAAMVMAVIFG